MRVLAWLAFPVVATLLAMCWAAWRGRDRGPRRSGGAFASVEEFRRFNDALAAPGPSAIPERRRGLVRRKRSGTVRGAGSLEAAQGASTGEAGMSGSAESAGQGS